MKITQIPTDVATCCEVLFQAGHQAYPVGGAVRDLLLGYEPDDWDVATSALPDTVCALFPGSRPTGLKHGTISIVCGSHVIEVTTFRQESAYSDGRRPDSVTFVSDLATDLARRDFAINALALRPDGTIIDLFDGLHDLRHGLLHCIGDPEVRFHEDALRMLRAVRLAAQLNFDLGQRELLIMRQYPHWTQRISAQRTRIELERALLCPIVGKSELFFSLGLLNHFLTAPCTPDLTPLAALPAELPARWGALCRILINCGAIAAPEPFLRALCMEKRTIRAILSWLDTHE